MLTPEREGLLRLKADRKAEKDLRALWEEIDRLRTENTTLRELLRATRNRLAHEIAANGR